MITKPNSFSFLEWMHYLSRIEKIEAVVFAKLATHPKKKEFMVTPSRIARKFLSNPTPRCILSPVRRGAWKILSTNSSALEC